MSAETVIEQCRADGLAVTANGGQLVVTGAPEAIDTWRLVLKEHKNELLAYLASDRPKLYVARIVRFQQHGLSEAAAEPLAQRLALRDSQRDERHMCLECAHLYGTPTAWRCATRASPTRAGHAIPPELADVLQRCRAFTLSLHPT